MTARWNQGRAVVDDILARGRLDRVHASRDLAEEMLDRADRHLRSAETLSSGDDIEGAFNLTYDAARLALAAILLNQGLRAKGGDGAHAVLLETIHAQLQPPPDTIFAQFDWIRRTRNDTQYPDVDRPAASSDDPDEALPAARAIVERARLVVPGMPPFGH